MKKSDLLRLIESIPDDADIVYLDDEGNFVDSLEIIDERVLGRFTAFHSQEISFYANYRHYDNWKHLYDQKCVILG